MFLGIMILFAIIGTVIAITQTAAPSATSTSTNPCEMYKPEDLASGVSHACFSYIWTNAGCKSTVPDGYAGWYVRSPDGGKTVMCIPPNTGVACGAGSFSAILNNAWHCDLNYRGY